jgi:hypothetical protein
MTILTFLILALAVYRLTHFLVFDKLFEPIRSLFVIRNFHAQMYTLKGDIIRRFIGKIMICFWCAGIWVSAAVFLTYLAYPPLLWLYAIWAAAGVQAYLHSNWVKSVGYPEMVEAPHVEMDESEISAARGIKNALVITLVPVIAVGGGWLALELYFGW